MRYKSLDGLRGIISLVVLLHHCLLVNSYFLKIHLHQISTNENNIFLVISHLFWAGHESVLLFFILSGFVLHIYSIKIINYKEYIIKRFIRIYFPYIISIVISASLYILFNLFDHLHSSPKFSEWLNDMWPRPIDYKAIVSAIFMTGYNTHSINTVTWSLIHEIRISIIFPCLILLVIKKNNIKSAILITFGIFLIYLMNSLLIPNLFDDDLFLKFLYSLNDTLYYMIFFLMGIYLSINKDKIKHFFKHLDLIKALIFILLGVVLFLFEWIFPFLSKFKYSVNFYESKLSFFIVDLFISLGILIIISMVLYYKPIKNLFELNILVFLGKISYSIYLLHPIVILLIIHTFGNNLNFVSLVLTNIIASLLISIIFHLKIESRILLSFEKLKKSKFKKVV